LCESELQLMSGQYWACLAFICLAVPEDHPFWTSEEELPGNTIPKIKALEHPGHIMRYCLRRCTCKDSLTAG
jgi:hypothetical protein